MNTSKFTAIQGISLIGRAWSALVAGLLALVLFASQATAQVPKIILDADMSSDHDDIGAIATLHGLADLGECQILGMMVSSLNGATPLCMDAINTYYGRPNIPIGVRPDIGGIGSYPGTIASEFPHDLTSASQCPTAVSLYRQILASQPDNSVTIVTIGYLTNLKALLQSGPDQYSGLSGTALVAQKVKLLSCMGGAYPGGNEFNFRSSSDDSAYVVVNNWPTRATYSGFEIGNPIVTGGKLQQTGTNNPIRRVYQLKGGNAHASWDQTAVYNAVRESEGVWGAQNVGHNNTDVAGANWWSTEFDPTGNQDQAYLLQRARTPVQSAIDALMMAPPNNGSASAPSQPTFLRATPVGTSRVDLQWTDNAYNETGFTIERKVNGVYTQVETVGANVKTFSHTGLTTTANSAYRVKATNATGSSDYTYIWLYSGWTEVNFANTGVVPALYNYYQSCHLSWARGGDFRPDHAALNNDSTHGQNVSVSVDVGAQGAQGSFYVYLFYQGANNWYRLNVNESSAKFEKRIGGTVSQIGSLATVENIGNGTPLRNWKVDVTSAGSLKFTVSGTTLLNVSDTLSFTTGLIGLGGNARTPIWENFNFDTTGGGGGSAPGAPTGLTATAGNAQVTLNWTASAGATSYNICRGTTANGQSATPIATGITGTSYTNTGLTNGTTYYYKVAAVNASGTSAYSNEASATPSAGGSAPAAPTGLTATAGNAQVGLGWTASSGATSYNIYRGTTANGQSATPIATGITGTSYTNTGLTNGTTYYYKVAAVNASGTSAYSNEASATPASGGGGGATVANSSFETPVTGSYIYNPAGATWVFTGNGGIQRNGSAFSGTAAVAPDGVQTAFLQSNGTAGAMSQSVNFGTAGSYTITFKAARRYSTIQPIQVKVDSTVVGTYTPSTNNFETITTASVTVTAGSHTITFTATDGTGDKATFIDQVSIAGGGGGGSAPAAPTGLSATAGNAQVALSWTASPGATSYNVYRGTTAGGQSATPIATGITGTTYTNTGLTNGTTYYYKVAAVNASGTSAYSNEANATPAVGGTAPGAPASLTATAGNALVNLTWPASSGATSYEVYRGTSSNGQNSTPIASGITGTSYSNTGLTNGTTYYYKVKAVNTYGSSGYSNEASATPSAGGGGSAAFANASFEAPSVGSYLYNPAGSSWTWTNNAGVQKNGSAYSGTTAVAPDGVQTAFLQSMNSTVGKMSQAVSFSTAGNYTITFKAARRYGVAQPVQIKVDGAVVGTYSPSSNTFETITTAAFSVAAGSRTIEFSATDSVGDKTIFIDQVSITAVP
jgi:fibronectin type 3 domain-containing protein